MSNIRIIQDKTLDKPLKIERSGIYLGNRPYLLDEMKFYHLSHTNILDIDVFWPMLISFVVVSIANLSNVFTIFLKTGTFTLNQANTIYINDFWAILFHFAFVILTFTLKFIPTKRRKVIKLIDYYFKEQKTISMIIDGDDND